MPGVIAHGKGVSDVRGKAHSASRVETAIRQLLLEPCADIADRVVGWEVELDSDAFPMGIGMLWDVITRDIAGEHRNGIKSNLPKTRSKAPFEHGRKPGDEC